MSYSSVGLFAGIGGIEQGLEQAGFRTQLLCEVEPAAQAVLRAQFPGVSLAADVRELAEVPKVDLLSAGFPCQDLSQAGKTAGIRGEQSGLVQHVFRLIEYRVTAPTWLLLENVSFMLRLDRGSAMDHLAGSLEDLGYRWAYRVVDSRSFGVPQRRQRVLLLASRTEDPRPVLLSEDAGEPERDPNDATSFGFYWTEGLRGVGWAVDAVPTLKGGSTIGIASPPAIWRVADGGVFTPDLRDAERLQGFPQGWTVPVGHTRQATGKRWKLVGNAVTTGVANWIGSRLVDGRPAPFETGARLVRGTPWPDAAWGDRSGRWGVRASAFPSGAAHPALANFLEYPGSPLSQRATAGFLSRARAGSLRFHPGFLEALERHVTRLREADLATTML